jgi:hypothetical protein
MTSVGAPIRNPDPIPGLSPGDARRLELMSLSPSSIRMVGRYEGANLDALDVSTLTGPPHRDRRKGRASPIG